VFGFFAFRSRIRGVYFSIITQALTYALMLWFFRNDAGFGGNNGLTDFKRIYGYPLRARHQARLFVLSGAGASAASTCCAAIVTSKLGRICARCATRGKVMFMGYSPLRYKLFVWTLSAVLCGLAGALYVPQVGIINPSEMQPPTRSRWRSGWRSAARATLGGAALGAFVVNGAKSWFTVAAPDLWLYVLGRSVRVRHLFFPAAWRAHRHPGHAALAAARRRKSSST
jgi:urea transport system permease protein